MTEPEPQPLYSLRDYCVSFAVIHTGFGLWLSVKLGSVLPVTLLATLGIWTAVGLTARRPASPSRQPLTASSR